MEIEDLPETPESRLRDGIDDMLAWIAEDYGEGFSGAVVVEMMEFARHRPEMTFEMIVDEVALNWSK